jgi:hypothetical protein
MAEVRQSLADRFEAKVERIPFMGCWAWMGATHERGYGIIGLGPRELGNERAHRTAYRLYRGEIPEDKIVMHKCGNTNCVNPWHLEVGTHKDNAQDTLRMGRNFKPNNKGTNAKWAKLDHDKAKEILEAKGGKKGIGTALAKKFNVSKSAVYRIWEGKNWQTL